MVQLLAVNTQGFKEEKQICLDLYAKPQRADIPLQETNILDISGVPNLHRFHFIQNPATLIGSETVIAILTELLAHIVIHSHHKTCNRVSSDMPHQPT